MYLSVFSKNLASRYTAIEIVILISVLRAETHSDSETTSLHNSVAVSDRGYTSDSELYDTHPPDTPIEIDTQVKKVSKSLNFELVTRMFVRASL